MAPNFVEVRKLLPLSRSLIKGRKKCFGKIEVITLFNLCKWKMATKYGCHWNCRPSPTQLMKMLVFPSQTGERKPEIIPEAIKYTSALCLSGKSATNGIQFWAENWFSHPLNRNLPLNLSYYLAENFVKSMKTVGIFGKTNKFWISKLAKNEANWHYFNYEWKCKFHFTNSRHKLKLKWQETSPWRFEIIAIIFIIFIISVKKTLPFPFISNKVVTYIEAVALFKYCPFEVIVK